MKDLGESQYVLGIKIIQDKKNKIIALSQENYIGSILSKYNMQDSKNRFTPFTTRKLKNRDGNYFPSLNRDETQFPSLFRDGTQFPSLFRDEKLFSSLFRHGKISVSKFPSLKVAR